MVRSLSLHADWLVIAGVVGVTAALGCMVDNTADTPAEVGGTGGVGGATGGSAGTGGTGTAGAPPTACTPNPEPQLCAGFVAPAWGDPVGSAGALLLSWDTYTAGDGKWGA
jgi:hypothetical protein